MKKIPLTQGQFAIVDDEDFEELSRYKWRADRCASSQCFYAVRSMYGQLPSKVSMHRQVMNAQPGEDIDHRNHNGLDNCRSNLRHCTKSQNAANRRGLSVNNTSGFRGVTWDKQCTKWRARLDVNGKRHHLGLFSAKEDAAKAYKKAATQQFGQFASLNTIDEPKFAIAV